MPKNISGVKINKFFLILAFTVYLCLLSWLIIFKCNLITSDLHFGYRILNLIPFSNMSASWGQALDYFLNVVVYLPFGMYLSLLTNKNIKLKVIIIALSSVFYETLQYILAFGTADITDVIANTLGGVLGMLIYALLKKLLTPKVVNGINACVTIIGVPVVIFAVISTVLVFDVYFL